MIASDAMHGLKFLQLVGILSEGGEVKCGIRHKMHRRAGNLSGVKTNRGKKHNAKNTQQRVVQ
ncbi:hypothetical protein BF17_07595 [Yersinia similis]|uniref:30S ribosomal protein S13 n=1 Tax=Yersinia similis TaxID=367190 RepID=A0ABM5Q413_9GAMM|nr:hypothetical protein BF17_07595 [Yersinia similis]